MVDSLCPVSPSVLLIRYSYKQKRPGVRCGLLMNRPLWWERVVQVVSCSAHIVYWYPIALSPCNPVYDDSLLQQTTQEGRWWLRASGLSQCWWIDGLRVVKSW